MARIRRDKSDLVPAWSDAVDAFVATLVAAERSSHTLGAYRADLGRLAAWYQATFGEPVELFMLSAGDLRDWKRYQVETLRHAPKTVNRRLAAVASLLRWAEGLGHTLEIPMPAYVREVRRGPQWLTVKDERALVRAVERAGNPRDVAIVLTLLKSGLRIFELAALECPDVTISPRKGEVLVRRGKGAKQRTVPLHMVARGALSAYLKGRRAGPVFLGQRGPMTKSGMQKVITAYGHGIGIDLGAHVLRHTCAKRLVDAGTPLHVVARILGHESTKTTELYVEPSQDDLQGFIDRLAGGEGD